MNSSAPEANKLVRTRLDAAAVNSVKIEGQYWLHNDNYSNIYVVPRHWYINCASGEEETNYGFVIIHWL